MDSTVQPTDLTILVLLPDTAQNSASYPKSLAEAVEELLQRTLRSLTEAQGLGGEGLHRRRRRLYAVDLTFLKTLAVRNALCISPATNHIFSNRLVGPLGQPYSVLSQVFSHRRLAVPQRLQVFRRSGGRECRASADPGAALISLIGFCEVQIDQRIRQEADRRSALYKGALEGILKQGTGQAVVALWCGDVLAPDALWCLDKGLCM